MRIAREEIFGPVLSIMPYDDVDEAVEIADSTDYGLAARVWSNDPETAMATARRLRAGQVSIDDGAFDPAAPFGGYKLRPAPRGRHRRARRVPGDHGDPALRQALRRT